MPVINDTVIGKLNPITKIAAVFALGLSALAWPDFTLGLILVVSRYLKEKSLTSTIGLIHLPPHETGNGITPMRMHTETATTAIRNRTKIQLSTLSAAFQLTLT